LQKRGKKIIMTCLRPINLNPFGEKDMLKSKSIIPYRKCVNCLASKSLQFGSRCYRESTSHQSTYAYSHLRWWQITLIDDFGQSVSSLKS